jgi:Mg2+/Co2+ transporter CorB
MWAMHASTEIGPVGITVILTLVILIFSEMTPKTLAALYPEKFAFPASLPLLGLQKLSYPLVWVLSAISNGLLRVFGVRVGKSHVDPVTREELRTIVLEAKGKIAQSHQDMLLRILDLETVTVDDVMVPKSEISGLNLDASMSDIRASIVACSYTWMPVYRGQIDHVHGLLKVRRALHAIAAGDFNQEMILKIAEPAYFIPESTPLSAQLSQFRTEQRALGLVVDEYGDIQGMVTLDDVLEEIVGEFSGTVDVPDEELEFCKDGSVVVPGAMTIREINRETGWGLPDLGPKTLSGLVVEYLELMPKEGVGLRIVGLPMEVSSVLEHRIDKVKVYPELRHMDDIDQ